ncbi:prepilin-type N-terminal cleavage/methylation domain-containing protein [Candidatus Halobeggiatoa sp. HSG11]|nr:prepilin-type N-terminal cleavage/methylation domain-containing protein [Candidatus Halobeggiatoa sp. HSG11]
MKINNGFTLIEIAIVFIIIGLVMGTVLKGTELITNAKIKNIENNFSSISRAITLYREHYHQLPGDDDGASRFKSGIDVGNGDGTIDGSFNSTDNSHESRLLWLHLRYSKIVGKVSSDLINYDDNQKQQPQNAFGGLMGVSSDSNGLFVGFTNIPGNIAVILESHSDDEQPNTGRIRTDLDYDGDNGTANVKHQIYFSF